MPELPEVETMKLQLGKFLTRQKLLSVTVNNRKIFSGDEKKIISSKVIGSRRFGKVTVIDFDNKYSLLTHVKMTGQFIYQSLKKATDYKLSKKVVGGVPGPHTIAIFNFEKGVLYYNDFRRFSWMKIEKTVDVEKEKFIKNLGPDMLQISFEDFSKIVTSSRRNIKVLLTDQSKIGGIGNIYVNDALWLSCISPRRSASSLSIIETKKLFNAINTVLQAGLKYGGASELAFVTPDGKEGEYQNHTLVYNHTGMLCTRCKKSKIEKFFLSSRGTYYCQTCQK